MTPCEVSAASCIVWTSRCSSRRSDKASWQYELHGRALLPSPRPTNPSVVFPEDKSTRSIVSPCGSSWPEVVLSSGLWHHSSNCALLSQGRASSTLSSSRSPETIKTVDCCSASHFLPPDWCAGLLWCARRGVLTQTRLKHQRTTEPGSGGRTMPGRLHQSVPHRLLVRTVQLQAALRRWRPPCEGHQRWAFV